MFLLMFIQTNFDTPLLIYVKLIKLLERGEESDCNVNSSRNLKSLTHVDCL